MRSPPSTRVSATATRGITEAVTVGIKNWFERGQLPLSSSVQEKKLWYSSAQAQYKKRQHQKHREDSKYVHTGVDLKNDHTVMHIKNSFHKTVTSQILFGRGQNKSYVEMVHHRKVTVWGYPPFVRFLRRVLSCHFGVAGK